MSPYAVTIFVGAFLLFLVQPLIGKYLLPWFGGAPAVWTTCLLFFQSALLGGYLYAHLSIRWLRPRRQALLQLGLVAAALALLPITPAESWKPAGGGHPVWEILGLLMRCIGLPYFVLAATGPLLQSWFSRTCPGATPFRLYALSNLGSLLALLSFPFYFESHFTRAAQCRAWGWALWAYAAGCLFCAGKVWRAPPLEAAPPAKTGARTDAAIPTRGQMIFWILLPACASVLLLATTNKICQEVAVIPFLWVLPLALYLLSFTICFDNPRWYARLPFGLALVAGLAGVGWTSWRGAELSSQVQIGIYCASLFVCCMVCHGELCRLKPEPRRLTGFYLMIAGGGALGGFLVAVVAPLVFSTYAELPWGLLGCGLLFLLSLAREWQPGSKMPARRQFAGSRPGRALGLAGGALGLLILAFVFWRQAHQLDGLLVRRSRNFYGVLAVLRWDLAAKADGLALVHGRTVHGLQFADAERRLRPTLYYGENSGAGLAMTALPEHQRRIGLVGLGAGTLAAYARPGDYVRIYEIDPEVRRLAATQFQYLENCPAKFDVAPGDARLSLEQEAPQEFDLLALDAFSDDTIPVHLLTREAFQVYERHLRTNGIVAVHISNTSLNLEPVLANVARRFDYHFAVIEHAPGPDQRWMRPSTWALLSHSRESLHSPRIRLAARPPQTNSVSIPLWTDDFASLFQVRRAATPVLDDFQHSKMEVEISQKLSRERDPAAAANGYRRALKRDPFSPILLNNLAFLLATTPDPAVRDGTRAVELARRACELTHYRDAPMAATLAAVCSEAGQFAEAAAMAEKTCWLLSESGDQASLRQNAQLLRLYRSGHPFHERATMMPQNQ